MNGTHASQVSAPIPAPVPTVSLRTAAAPIDMPQLGFGVYQIPAGETADVVGTALRTGYRSIDTATLYGNEEGVGQAIRDSGLPRDEVFVTTKVWNDDQGYDATLRAFDASAARLGLDVVDLYLIHWPEPDRERYLDTWRALLRLRADGRIRAAGVCNFEPDQLERLAAETGELPAINQIKLNPTIQRRALREFHDAHDIRTEAWAPLAKGGALLTDRTILAVAERHGVTAAQVVLRWHLQQGIVVIPKSATPSRIAANADIFGFELSDNDMRTIASLDGVAAAD